MKSAKFREVDHGASEMDNMSDFNEQEEESYSSLGFGDNDLIENEE